MPLLQCRPEAEIRQSPHPGQRHVTLIFVILPSKLLRRALACVTLACATGASSQVPLPDSSAPNSQTLPAAPSAVLTQTSPASSLTLARAAGSGITYTPASTFKGPGDVTVERPQDRPLSLSLDDAISIGFARNLRLKYDTANQRVVKGYRLQIANALLPSLTATANSQAQEINLAALGFKPAALAPVLQQFGLSASSFSTIVKVYTTQATLSTKQELFDLPAYEFLRASQSEFKVESLNLLNSRGDLVLSVGTAYFKVLAGPGQCEQRPGGRALFQDILRAGGRSAEGRRGNASRHAAGAGAIPAAPAGHGFRFGEPGQGHDPAQPHHGHSRGGRRWN